MSLTQWFTRSAPIVDALFGAVGALNVNAGISVGYDAFFDGLLSQGSGFHPEGVSPQKPLKENTIVPLRRGATMEDAAGAGRGKK